MKSPMSPGFRLVSRVLAVHLSTIVKLPAAMLKDSAWTPPRPWLMNWLFVVFCLSGLVTRGASADRSAAKGAPVTVQNLAGENVQPLADAGQKATVLFFVMHECPVANGYAPEISRIMNDYTEQGVRCYVVYVEADLSRETARQHAKDYSFKSGAVMDPRHLLVKAAGATISPEAAVFSPRGEVLYLGRIDDRVADFGKRRVEPTRRDLRLTLDAVLAGRPVPARLTKAVGCYIPEEHPSKAEH